MSSLHISKEHAFLNVNGAQEMLYEVITLAQDNHSINNE